MGPMGYWGGEPLAESSRCRQELRPETQGTVKKSFPADVCFFALPTQQRHFVLTVSKD